MGDLRIAAFAALGVIACSSVSEVNDTPLVARLAPVTVSEPSGWRLFDRSVASAYTPGVSEVVVGIEPGRALAGMKVFGPSPYVLHVGDSRGHAIAVQRLDKVAEGWQMFTWPPVTTNEVQLRFEPVGVGAIPELELWGVAGPADASELSFPAIIADTTIEAGDCAKFSIDVSRPPSQWRRARLAYTADGAFRPFSMRRTINRGASVGGTWLAARAGARAFVEEIDPTLLVEGTNELSLCVPQVAHSSVSLADLRLVGELDRGVRLAERATIGTGIDGAALLDADPATHVAVAAGQKVELQFDRLIAPDAVVVRGGGGATPRVDCIDMTNAATALAADTTAGVLRLDGGASACAALSLTYDVDVLLDDIDVIGSGAAEPVDWPRIVVTSAHEHFGDLAWISGYTTRPAKLSGALRVTVRGKQADSVRGDFAELLSRLDEPSAPWPVELEARSADGTKTSRTVVLERDARPDLANAKSGAQDASAASVIADTKFGRVGNDLVENVTPQRSKSIRLGTHVSVEVPAGAVVKPTDIKARHLAASAIPPLDAGMIDVTAPKGHGYEFLPHGQKFARAVSIDLPFDPQLLPADMTAEDVSTYYYDERVRHWKKLDRAAVDVGKHVIRSSSDHFTIMINAVLAMPTNPAPLSFDPTSLSKIPAASPGAGIALIEPPAATSTGDATTALPLELPAGRGAYSPGLAIRYSSGGSNGWLGVGWDLAVSRIEIDTRWGVPTYADGEEPRYTFDGVELVPTLETEGPTCATGTGRRYHPRVEGSFAHILRCGTNPSNYYFQVYDRDGTKYIFGSQSAGNTGNPNVVSLKTRPCGTAPCGNGIVRWNLRSVVDTYGNTTTFNYQVDTIAGAETAREVYPQSIVYTSHPGKPPHYTVDFTLDNGSRPDLVVSGRAGYKATTRKLLRSVRVRLDTNVIREYVLTYAHGQFEKSVLNSIRVYGAGGCAAAANAFALPTCSTTAFLDDHTFEYYVDATGFDPVVPWSMVSDPDPTRATIGKGESSGWASSLSVRAKSQTSPTTSVSAGLGANLSRSTRNEKASFYDINGDGLADQIFATSSTPVVLYNKTATLPQFNTTGPAVSGLTQMGRDRSSSWGVNADVGIGVGGFGASASGGISNSTSRSDRLMTDLDGDGFLDAVTKTGAWFSAPCPTGLCFTPGQFPATSAISAANDPLLGQFATEIEERLVTADPVIQWTAPYNGTVMMGGSVGLVGNQPVDGVAVELVDHNDVQLASWVLTTPATPIAISIPEMPVTAGDTYYLRISSNGQPGNSDTALRDEVRTSWNVLYVHACHTPACTMWVSPTIGEVAREPTYAKVFVSELTSELRVNATPFHAPVAGTLRVQGSIFKDGAMADIRACLQHFPAGTQVTDYRCDDPSSPATLVMPTTFYPQSTIIPAQPLDKQVTVAAGDLLVLRAESDWSIDPWSIKFQPGTFAYSEACIPNDSGSGCTPTTDPEELANVPVDPSSLGFYVAPVTPPEPFGAVPLPFVAPVSSWYGVLDFPNPLGTTPIEIAYRVSGVGTLTTFWCTTATCHSPFNPFVAQGFSLSIEVIADAATAAFPVGPVWVHMQALHQNYYVPLIFRKRYREPADTHTPFVGDYQGWRTTLWNQAIPFKPGQLLSAIDDLDAVCDAIDPASDECLDRLLDIGLSAFAPVSAFTGVPFASVVTPTYRGAGSAAFITEAGGSPYTVRMNVGRLGQLGPPIDGVPSLGAGGVFDPNYIRLSGTRSYFLGAGVSGGDVMPNVSFGGSLNGSVSRSWTRSTTDLFDMTGDGIADVVAGQSLIKGTLSGPASTPQAIYPFDDGFRRTNAVDYTVDLGKNATVTRSSGGGRVLDEGLSEQPDVSFGYGSNTGLAMGRSQTTHDVVDMNGDGLPDQVQRSGNQILVRYNFGTSLGAWEPAGTLTGALATTKVDNFQSFEDADSVGDLDSSANALSHDSTLTQHRTTSYSLWLFNYSKTTRTTSSRTTRKIADLNGDGLPDILLKRADQNVIRVQYNRGGSFAAPTTWTTPAWIVGSTPLEMSPAFSTEFDPLLLAGTNAIGGPDVLGATSSQTGVTRTGGFHIPMYSGPETEVSIGGTLSTSRDTDTFELALVDVTGDGAPDHVFRRGQSSNPAQAQNIYVKRNKATGRANLLRRVHRPLGGTITLDYGTEGNTIDMPQRRRVLASVELDDGVDLGTAYASPNLLATIRYSGGKYDRYEREFLGFSKVITQRPDGGSLEQYFNTTSFALHGALVRELRKANSLELVETTTNYAVLDVLDGSSTAVPLDPTCTPKPRVGIESCTPRHPVMISAAERRTDGESKTHTSEDLARDRFGNVTASKDAGDDAIATDDVFATALYSNDITKWILGRATSLEVRDAANTLLRARSGAYNNQGSLTSLGVDTGGGVATSTYAVDAFGNVTTVTLPQNADGESQQYQVTFDATLASYPISVTDAFGHTSTASYDLRFGVPTIETDVNGVQIQNTFDAFGRLVSVRGPYDGSTPSLQMSYFPAETPARAVSVTTSSAPSDYTGALPPPITTVTIIDGHGETVEVRRSSTVDGVNGMTTTGMVKRDAMGRETVAYQPFFTPGASTAFIAPVATLGTTTTFDVRDRVIAVTYPDSVTEQISYAIEVAPSGSLFYRTRHVDAIGHARESYSDQGGHVRAFVEHPTATTSSVTTYDYVATGELSTIVDAENTITKLAYDRRGLQTKFENPDSGAIEDRFDLAGNRVATVAPNHAAISAEVRFHYDRDRLESVEYPSKAPVAFTYGGSGTPFGVGRLVRVTDETGSVDYTYGKLGEIRRTLREVQPFNDAEPQVFDLRTTSDSLGRALQMQYPDGETVSNAYGASGLTAVSGTGSSWSHTYASDIRYDVFGQRTKLVFGNGVVSTWSYDPQRLRLSTLTTTLPSATKIQDLHFTYDTSGNPTEVANTLASLTGSGARPGPSSLKLTYDGVDRMLTALGDAQLDATSTTHYQLDFAYSASHKLLQKSRAHTIAGSPVSATSFSNTYGYGASRPHLPTQVGAIQIAYDASGNPISRTGPGINQQMVWDDDNRLVEVDSLRSSYDANGTRTVRWDTNTDQQTIFSSPFFDLELGADGIKHIFAGDVRVASAFGGFKNTEDPPPPSEPTRPYYLHADHLGSTSVVSDETGAVHQSVEYFADGETWIDRAPTTPVNGILFNGKPFDPQTGFYDYGQRFYDPRTSLFLGIDPAMLDASKAVGNPKVLSPFAYAAHSPARFIDPDGREPKTYEGAKLAALARMYDVTPGPDFNWDNFADMPAEGLARAREAMYAACSTTSCELRALGGAGGWTASLGEAVTGAGDTVTMGASKAVRDRSGFEDTIDEESAAYVGGEIIGTVAGSWGLGKSVAGGISSIVSASKAARAAIWRMNPFKRGFIIEAHLGGNLVSNFPTIDRFMKAGATFFGKGVVTSIKSINLGAKSYKTAGAVASVLKGYVRKVAGFTGRTWRGREITIWDVSSRVLHVAIPAGRQSAQHLDELKAAVEYGKKMNVEVIIDPF